MKHVVFYSGGCMSWATAKRVIGKYGKENVELLFTDTKIEDEDLYRFLDETSAQFDVMLHKVADGRTPFEVYRDVRYLGNGRIAPCSHKLKHDVARKFVEENYNPDDVVLYMGIDWTETHRTVAPIKIWKPYTVRFPLCAEPYVIKEHILAEIVQHGIKLPRLYEMGFSHNNCGGFCCRAGQAHFVKLYHALPERYLHYEQEEENIRQFLDKDVSILRKIRKGIDGVYTLRELRKDIEQKQEIDMEDVGGCGCMVEYEGME